MKEKSVEKLKILFTVVSHGKSGVVVDFLEENGSNAEFIMHGEGLKGGELKSILSDTSKDVIISFISADKSKDLMRKLDDKFDKIRNAYAVSWSVPLSSIVGSSIYKFLLDYREGERNERK